VKGRVEAAQNRLARGDEQMMLDMMNRERINCPELMLADVAALSESQVKALTRYQARQRELDMCIDDIVARRSDYHGNPKGVAIDFTNRLKSLDRALDSFIEALLPIPTPNKIGFCELVRHVAKHVSDCPDVIEQTIRNALVLNELSGEGYGYDVNDPQNPWHRYKSKMPTDFWKLAELEIGKVLAGQAINEIGVVPVDRPDSFQDFERGVDFMSAGEVPLYKDVSFKFEDVRRLWPPANF
jgi:hypothetical protein